MSFYCDIDVLEGATITQIDKGVDELRFTLSNGTVYAMRHNQDCCEHVYLEDIEGDFDDLLNTPVLSAYESSCSGDDRHPVEDESNPGPLNNYDESYTWTFYRISTIKGTVVLRWYGTSNGYYSESVDFQKVA